jgi:hypothetical protein
MYNRLTGPLHATLTESDTPRGGYACGLPDDPLNLDPMILLRFDHGANAACLQSYQVLWRDDEDYSAHGKYSTLQDFEQIGILTFLTFCQGGDVIKFGMACPQKFGLYSNPAR